MATRIRWNVCSALLLALAIVGPARANNIQVLNPTLTGINYAQNSVQVQFDIVWEHSWRTAQIPDSWDAAWIFVKYRHAGTGAWGHALLNNTGHVAPAGSVIDEGLLMPGTTFDPVTNPAVGVFLHLSAGDFGTFNGQGVQLRWNYGASGLAYTDIADISVFALEMVYIPEEPFYVGDGTTVSVRGQFHNAGSVTTPFHITSEAGFTLGGTTSGSLGNNNGGWAPPDDFNNSVTQSLPATFPKGFKGFYCMKHEVSQQGYVDFLNTLTRDQQDGRTRTNLQAGITIVSNRYVLTNTSTMPYRNGIRCDASVPASGPITFYCDMNGNGVGGELNDGQWVACNHLTWGDLAAYLDWAGLRPMTELEFEKACRGPMNAVVGEFAWGSTTIDQATALSNAATSNELGNTAANTTYGYAAGVAGPVRVGMFAKASTTRQQAGAGYYGVLDLSGNVYEQTVSVGSSTGRAYTGTHGNGLLTTSGGHDAPTWPGTVVTGTGLRGGNWAIGNIILRTSDRYAANVATSGGYMEGGRGVRTRP